jgi:hypothetical protein
MRLRATFLMDVSAVLDFHGLDTEGLFTCDAVPEHSYVSNLMDRNPYNSYGRPCDVCGGPELTAATMRALLPYKRTANNYQALLDDVRAQGQLAPIHTIGAFINNGGHRIAIAVDLGWDTILCTETGTDSENFELVQSWRRGELFTAVPGDAIDLLVTDVH